MSSSANDTDPTTLPPSLPCRSRNGYGRSDRSARAGANAPRSKPSARPGYSGVPPVGVRSPQRYAYPSIVLPSWSVFPSRTATVPPVTYPSWSAIFLCGPLRLVSVPPDPLRGRQDQLPERLVIGGFVCCDAFLDGDLHRLTLRAGVHALSHWK